MNQLLFHRLAVLTYFIVSFIFATIFVSTEKPRAKFISLILVFWFMTFNFYKAPKMWAVSRLIYYFRQIDIQLAVFLGILLLINFLSKDRPNSLLKKPKYEKYLLAYLSLSVFLYFLHSFLGNISNFRMVSFTRIYIAAFFLYFGFRRYTSLEFVRIIIKTVIYMAIASSLISIVQFFMSTDFIRIGPYHDAFPGHDRSSGIFRQPYDNGVFLSFAIFVVAYQIKQLKYKIVLISLFSLGIILVFTRGIWLAFIFVLIFHAYYFYKEKFRKMLFVFGSTAMVVGISFGAYIVNASVFSNEAFRERVFKDTVTVRLLFYKFILEAIPNSWLIGYGDVQDNRVYFDGMVVAGQPLMWALGRQGGIHNVVLQEAFLRGIVVTAIFIMFFIHVFRYSARMSMKNNSFIYSIFSYYMMIFFFYFFSVASFLNSQSGILVIPLVGILSGIYYNKIDVSKFNMKIYHDKMDAKDIEKLD